MTAFHRLSKSVNLEYNFFSDYLIVTTNALKQQRFHHLNFMWLYASGYGAPQLFMVVEPVETTINNERERRAEHPTAACLP